MLAAIAALVFGQQIPDVRYLPIKQTELQFPVFAGAQEFAMGIKRQQSRTMGLFVNQLESGAYGDKIPINYNDVRVGHTMWSVSPGVYGSSSCMAISCDASRNQAWEYRKTIYGLKHKASRTWYVDDNGKLLGETCDVEMATGRWTMDVSYGAEEYTVTSSGPNKPRRTMTVTPGCGIEALTLAPFKPMLKPDPAGKESEVLMKEKEFYLLDPVSAAPVKYVARVSGSFSGEMFERKWTGREVEIVGGTEKFTAWLTHDGMWIKAVLASAGTYLILDQKPL